MEETSEDVERPLTASLSSKLFFVTRLIDPLAFSTVASIMVKDESFGVHFPPVVNGAVHSPLSSESIKFQCAGVAGRVASTLTGTLVSCNDGAATMEDLG